MLRFDFVTRATRFDTQHDKHSLHVSPFVCLLFTFCVIISRRQTHTITVIDYFILRKICYICTSLHFLCCVIISSRTITPLLPPHRNFTQQVHIINSLLRHDSTQTYCTCKFLISQFFVSTLFVICCSSRSLRHNSTQSIPHTPIFFRVHPVYSMLPFSFTAS